MTLLNACCFNNMSLNYYYYYLILCQRLFLSEVEERCDVRNLSSRWNSVFSEHGLALMGTIMSLDYISFFKLRIQKDRWWCHVNKMGAWMRRCPWLWLILDSQIKAKPCLKTCFHLSVWHIWITVQSQFRRYLCLNSNLRHRQPATNHFVYILKGLVICCINKDKHEIRYQLWTSRFK